MPVRTVFVVAVLYLFLFTSSPGCCARSERRLKRIINGEDLRDKSSGYTATNYFVWISNKHVCGAFESFKNLFSFLWKANSDYFALGNYNCDPNPQTVSCGGSLLTPYVVQTSCHCVAKKKDPDSEGVQWYVANNAYADMAVVFYGATSTDDMHSGYVSKKFLIHEKCSFKLKSIHFDYGMIVLRKAVAPYKGFASKAYNFAPVYSTKNIELIWERVHAKETVCLLVGFGRISGDPKNRTHPSVMQHTWGALQNFERCSFWRRPEYVVFNYTSNATWSCVLSLPDGGGSRVHIGDSGSPVTCDNEYYGLVSSYLVHLQHPVSIISPDMFPPIDTDVSIISPIKYSTFVNSAETRVSLKKKIAIIFQEKGDEPIIYTRSRLGPEELGSYNTHSGAAFHFIISLNVLVTLSFSCSVTLA